MKEQAEGKEMMVAGFFLVLVIISSSLPLPALQQIQSATNTYASNLPSQNSAVVPGFSGTSYGKNLPPKNSHAVPGVSGTPYGYNLPPQNSRAVPGVSGIPYVYNAPRPRYPAPPKPESLVKPTCKNYSCGSTIIPYPFGIGADCYAGAWYSITCNHSSYPPKPYLNHADLSLHVLEISLESQTVTVNSPMPSFCNASQTEINKPSIGIDLDKTSPFKFSWAGNIFLVLGCGSATLLDQNGTTMAACATVCNHSDRDIKGCIGINCCQISDIPSATEDSPSGYNVTMRRDKKEEDCVTHAVVDAAWFSANFSSPREFTELRHAPLVLKWRADIEGDNYSVPGCGDWRSVYSENNQPCACNIGMEGNPFLINGCRVRKECANCRWGCEEGYNLQGEYGWHCITKIRSKQPLILGFSVSGGSLLLLILSFGLYKVVRKQLDMRMKRRFFKQNGGLLLQQQVTSDQATFEKTKIFSSKELEKATDNFRKGRILGQGGQGTVYKGMLSDGKIVAIKKSKIVDESQVGHFINEILILSQVNHRNVIGILGCCLETEVPLLVYEFIPNGTLFELIHSSNSEFPLSWEMRLRIASEVSEALSYLHSACSVPIYHKDIKSSNILLDDKFRAKVSDFGTSRSISIDQTHLTTLVQGTFGYLDPEYFQSSHFTEKSDVYSFGVVLAELLTGKKPISSTRSGAEKSLATHFIISLQESRLFDILDIRVMKEGRKEDIMAFAQLASRCLDLNGRKRPTMKEVTMELDNIRGSALPFNVDQNFQETSCAVTEITESWSMDNASTTTGSCMDHTKESS